MNLWIVTIGSSDVQLDSDKDSREKGRTEKQRSDKVWRDWYDDIKPDCYDISFVPKAAFPDLEETYRIPSRVLGSVYQENSAEVRKEIWNYLTFPLLSNFSQRLKNLGSLGAIAYLLTDQSAIFETEEERRKPKSPYWDDTCNLEPILQRYFSQEFPGVTLISLKLSPVDKNSGLDDWDQVLDLVQNELKKIGLDSKADTVYVSHQAGTPAISSAVQFMSLARFRNNVQFLVTNEYSQETQTIPKSTYLAAIQLQEAQALLKRHDYAGVKLLVYDYLDFDTKILLDGAIQWNLAKFDEFANEIHNLSDRTLVEQVNKRSQQWWWTAYEAAYLAIIRHRQKNIVEALFHSFRAVEGLVCQWAEEKYKDYIYYDENSSPQIKEQIEEILPEYWQKIQEKNSNWLENLKKQNENRQAKGKPPKPISVGLFSQNLYSLLESVHPDAKKDIFLKKGLYSAKNERNQQFHRLLGLREENLFKAWEANDVDEWQSILLGCLNYIAKNDAKNDLRQEEFRSIQEASLMAKIHEKLVNAIASY